MWNPFRLFKYPNIVDDSRYQVAHQFTEDFEPTESVDYAWAYQHGKETLKLAWDAIAELDRKAQNMILFLGPSSGLLGAGYAFLTKGISSNHWLIMIFAVILTVSLICAIICALRVLNPRDHALGPSITDALKVANYYKESQRSLGRYTAAFGESVAILTIVAELKSRRLRWSYRLFIAAAITFIIGIAIIYYCLVPRS